MTLVMKFGGTSVGDAEAIFVSVDHVELAYPHGLLHAYDLDVEVVAVQEAL